MQSQVMTGVNNHFYRDFKLSQVSWIVINFNCYQNSESINSDIHVDSFYSGNLLSKILHFVLVIPWPALLFISVTKLH